MDLAKNARMHRYIGVLITLGMVITVGYALAAPHVNQAYSVLV
jgi:hypothetical protein